MLRTPAGVFPIHAHWPAAMPAVAAGTPLSAQFESVGNRTPLELLAAVAHALSPPVAEAPATAPDPFVTYLMWVDKPLGVAYQWSMCSPAARARGLTRFANDQRLDAPPWKLVTGAGVLSRTASHRIAGWRAAFERLDPAAVAQLQGRQPHPALRPPPVAVPPDAGPERAAYEAAFAERLQWSNLPLAVALDWASLPAATRRERASSLESLAHAAMLAVPPHPLVGKDGVLTQRGRKERKLEQAAFDVSRLPAPQRHLDTLRALARDRELKLSHLMDVVPARELLADAPELAEARDEDARRAGNREVRCRIESCRPDVARMAIWKSAVAWSDMREDARRALRMPFFASTRHHDWRHLRHYVTPSGDFPAGVLQLLDPAFGPALHVDSVVATRIRPLPDRVDDPAALSKAQRLAFEWHVRCRSGNTAPWGNLHAFARAHGVSPASLLNYVDAEGNLKRRTERTVETRVATQAVASSDPVIPLPVLEASMDEPDSTDIAIEVEVKQEPVEVLRHAWDNLGPILRTPDGEDALLDALQPPQKRLRTDDLGALVQRQKVTEWAAVGPALSAAFAHLPAAERKQRVREEQRRLTGEARAWLLLPNEARAARWADMLRVEHRGASGNGAVAVRPIRPFEFLGTYNGTYLPSLAALEREQERHGVHNVATYLYSTQAASRTVSAYRSGSVLSMVNEAGSVPENNAGVIRVGANLHCYVALRDIAEGEEVLVDYGPHYDRSGWPGHPIAIPDDDGIHVAETPPTPPSGTR